MRAGWLGREPGSPGLGHGQGIPPTRRHAEVRVCNRGRDLVGHAGPSPEAIGWPQYPATELLHPGCFGPDTKALAELRKGSTPWLRYPQSPRGLKMTSDTQSLAAPNRKGSPEAGCAARMKCN